jgi:hypothetical protein
VIINALLGDFNFINRKQDHFMIMSAMLVSFMVLIVFRWNLKAPFFLKMFTSEQRKFWFHVIFKMEHDGFVSEESDHILLEKVAQWDAFFQQERMEGISRRQEKTIFLAGVFQEIGVARRADLGRVESVMPVAEMLGGFLIIFCLLFFQVIQLFMES